MSEKLAHVGVREFRQDIAQYLDSAVPVAITRHGRTIGYYLPARGPVREDELQTLRQARERLAALLADYGIQEEEIVAAFRARRRA